MPSSMTGVGLAAGSTEIGDLRIEVRTVNGRSLVQKLRLASVCVGFEAGIEAAVRERLRRGTATIVIECTDRAGAGVDRAALAAAADELREVAKVAGVPPPTMADLMTWKAASSRQEPATSRPMTPDLAALLAKALDDLERHRQTEGDATNKAIAELLDGFESDLETAAGRAPQLVDHYRERLLQRVNEFVQTNGLEPVPAADLVREVAVHADRIDVAEELQRLRAHVDEFRARLGSDGEVGRRLEFLLQELLRETNTLGSKSPDTTLSHTVVAMKSRLDRIKEQVLNLE